MPDTPTPILNVASVTTALDTPEAAALRVEVNRISKDPNIGPREKEALTDNLYRKLYGTGELKIGSGITVTSEPGAAPAAAAPAEWVQEAQRELGANYDAEAAKVLAVGKKMFGDNVEAEEAFLDKLRASGMSDKDIFNMARKLG